MQKTVRFFKLDNEWYADVPGHDLEDNQMVAGADTVLEEIFRNRKLIDEEFHLPDDKCPGGKEADNGGEEVFITVADSVNVSTCGRPFVAKFVMKKHDEDGAEYIVTGPLAEFMECEGYQIWICNVTHDVLGEHPDSIYILDIC